MNGAPISSPAANTLYKNNILSAWISFDGTGTISISDSFNVASITDNGTGDYTITWDTDFANVNYSVVATNGAATQGTNNVVTGVFGASQAVGSTRVICEKSNGADVDQAWISVMAMGDQ